MLNSRTLARGLAAFFAAAVVLACVGCASRSPVSPPQLSAFQAAGAPAPVIDADKIAVASSTGPYHVVAGDVLELQLPAMAVNPTPLNADKVQTCLSRVSEQGIIRLPIVGEINVKGRTLEQTEAAVSAAYYPKYVVSPPTVVAKVSEYASIKVIVQGAVKLPGTYELRSDQQSLSMALNKAGGTAADGAGEIHIRRAGKAEQTVTLPIKGMNTPFIDAALADGDVVEVRKFDSPTITVLGLVVRPGVFPCQADTRLSLMQAIALAGGTNEVAQPSTATVHRRDASGKTVSLKLPIDPKGDGAKPLLMAGDVVSVDSTPDTQARLIFAQLLRIGLGVNAGYSLND